MMIEAVIGLGIVALVMILVLLLSLWSEQPAEETGIIPTQTLSTSNSKSLSDQLSVSVSSVQEENELKIITLRLENLGTTSLHVGVTRVVGIIGSHQKQFGENGVPDRLTIVLAPSSIEMLNVGLDDYPQTTVAMLIEFVNLNTIKHGKLSSRDYLTKTFTF